ncbi:MAG TPA: cytochrome C [Caldimonas sp.]|nr:cytochrome C [Caldimonas sp.]
MTTLVLAPSQASADEVVARNGEGIYRRGITGSGAPVEASRESGQRLAGPAVACINCHRRSGLGSKEGRTIMPPVAGRYLFNARSGTEELDLPFVEGARGNQVSYTDETLARAIREGVDSEGRALNYLMPRYALADADLAALTAYLKGLERRKVPGVTQSELHFATIITPDADPVKRRGMLSVLRQFFAERNARQPDPTAQMLTSGKNAFSKMMFKVNRRWELHVWELTGAESTWQEQLERHLAKQPILAVVSGLGGSHWEPVHAFCEKAEVPCILPNVEAPPADADRDFYSLYFSRGVLLEADLIRERLVGAAGARPWGKVRQVYRAGDVGEAGSGALAAMLKRAGITVSQRVLAREDPAASGLADALADLRDDEALVLWLRPTDLEVLPGAPRGAAVYLSGLMGGLERTPLPPAWRREAHVAYPFDLPDARRVRVDFAFGWFRIRQIPVIAEQVQADTYLACGLLSETVKHMVDNFVRDYLVERFEDTLEHRIVTGYYPRLSLATGQRFSSKGGYVVRFPDATGGRVIADSRWTVP